MTASDAGLRSRVEQLAPANPREALRLARGIADPWCRCQALAVVAHASPDPVAKSRLLKDAFSAATEIQDHNRTVSVSAWPLKVLCKSGQAKSLAVETARLLDLAQKLESPVRRADALNLVLGAVVSGPRALFRQVLDSFKAACVTPLKSGKRNRRGESLLAKWVVIVHRLEPSMADELMQCLSTEELQGRARSELDEFGHLAIETLCTWPNIARS